MSPRGKDLFSPFARKNMFGRAAVVLLLGKPKGPKLTFRTGRFHRFDHVSSTSGDREEEKGEDEAILRKQLPIQRDHLEAYIPKLLQLNVDTG